MDEQTPAVSVVIATYNSAQFLRDAVQSVLAQTVEAVEVVVVDDGSTDETPSLAADLTSDRRVRWIRQENAGQARAKNRGIEAAQAPIVGFCDADDLWQPWKLERQLPLFQRPEVGVVYSREQRFVTRGGQRVPVPGSEETPYRGRVTEPLFIENFVPFGTALVRRECLDRCGGFDERYRMGIDWLLWLKASLQYEFDYVDEVTCLYRVWDGQMSRNWRGRYEAAIPMMREFLAANPDLLPAQVRRRAWAHTYTNRGRLRAEDAHEYGAAFADIARALSHEPGYGKAWMAAAWIARAALLDRWSGAAAPGWRGPLGRVRDRLRRAEGMREGVRLFHARCRSLPGPMSRDVQVVRACDVAATGLHAPPELLQSIDGLPEQSLLFCVVDGSRIVSWGSLIPGVTRWPVTEIAAHLSLPQPFSALISFYTLPEFRGRGLYPLLLEAMHRYSADHGLPANLLIWCHRENEPSVRGIRKAGFVEVAVARRPVRGRRLVVTESNPAIFIELQLSLDAE